MPGSTQRPTWLFLAAIAVLFAVLPAPAQARCRAAGVSLYVAPNPARAGDAVQVFGRVMGGRCAPAVRVWRRVPGQRRFRVMTRVTLRPGGRYRAAFAAGVVETNSEWYATAGHARSPIVDQRVLAEVTLASTATFAISGDSETLSGQVIPVRAGHPILLQQRVAGRWRTMRRPRLSATSTFAVAHRFRASGA